jgi:hypothetical protein
VALSDAVKAEILSTRALTYRRATLAIGLVLACLHLVPGIDFSTLNLFGVRLSGPSENRFLVLLLIWVLLLYHAVMFGYYALRDWRVWERELTQGKWPREPFLPEVRMYLGLTPKDQAGSGRKLYGDAVTDFKVHYEDNLGPQMVWTATPRERKQATLSMSLVNPVRQKVAWFIAVDVGLPILLALFDLGLLIKALV